jgi:hypothetical protein
MAGRTPVRGFSLYALAALAAFLVLIFDCASAQQLAKRLILKDGSYQLASKWEVNGDRVRYFSAERGEWEEVPKSMVDWDATDKYEKDRAAGAPLVGAQELDKELASERQAEEARSPQVAPNLRLPSDGSVLMLDTFKDQPELVELTQNGSEINQNRKGNILRAAINPVAGAKANVELTGPHAKVQSHSTLPAIYVQSQPEEAAVATTAPAPPQEDWNRFRIVHMQAKADKRLVGDIKVAVYGKMTQEQKLVPTTAEKLTGGWVKVTPVGPLPAGEYALVEMLGKDGINLYVWDFGVNPLAPANVMALKPDVPVAQPSPNERPQLKKPQQN